MPGGARVASSELKLIATTDGSLVMGMPARVVRALRPEEVADIRTWADHYIALGPIHRDFSFGLPPQKPSVVAMSFSSLDPTLAPPGKHVLFTWGQYHPYELSNGENWDDIREREADKLYDLVCQYAPNMRGKMIARYIQTPLDLERTLGLLRANVMHLEMSLDQMFMFRPLPELSEYKVPGLPGLYLTGASTHPGGGVFAASGYNTARVILAERR